MRRSAPHRPWSRDWASPRCAVRRFRQAQSEGGLYVADAGSTFQVAAQQALAQNPAGAGSSCSPCRRRRWR